MARLLAGLFAAGATLALLSVVLPHSPRFNTRAILALLLVAYCAALGLVLAGSRVRPRHLHLVVGLGTTLIAGASYFSGESASYFSLFFLWVGLYAFYFFAPRQALGHLALVGLLYAVVLDLRSPSGSAVTPWLLTLGTLGVAGTLVARLVAEVRSHAADLAVVASASHEVLATSDPAMARSAICESARTVAGAVAAALFEPDAEGAILAATATAGVDLLSGPTASIRTVDEATRAYRSTQSRFVGDLAEGSSDPHDPAGPRAYFCQPILSDGATVGVLAVAWDRRLLRLPRRVSAAMNLLAAEAAVAIDHADLLARLEEAARTDHLTGFGNRRSLFEELPRELARAAREQRPLCLGMLDLDNFKIFNDTRGHQAGDAYLKDVAAAWRACLRPEDLIARYGGEEFTLVLPGCPLEDALSVVERVRAATPDGQTCSAGVALWDGAETPDQLIARTDQALYLAKYIGRDRAIAAA